MEQNDERSLTFTSIPKTNSEFTLILDDFVTSQTPSVVVLETINEGIVKVKVEADVMAYILYCLYSTFSSLQQRHHVVITWSSEGRYVLICATQRNFNKDSLLESTRQFLNLYHHLTANLVATKLNNHTKNITIHQYHKASLEIKRRHPYVMLKEIKTTGSLALYGYYDEVMEAKVTFVNVLNMTKKYLVDQKYNNEQFNSLPPILKRNAENKSINSSKKRPLQRQKQIEVDERFIHRKSQTNNTFSPKKKAVQQQIKMETSFSPLSSPTYSRKELRSIKGWRKYKTIENLKQKKLEQQQPIQSQQKADTKSSVPNIQPNNPNKSLERRLTLSNIETERTYEEINLKRPLKTNINKPQVSQQKNSNKINSQLQRRVDKFMGERAFSFEPKTEQNSFSFPNIRGTRSNNERTYLNSNEKVNLPPLLGTMPRKSTQSFNTNFQTLQRSNKAKEAKIPDIKSPFNFLLNLKEAYSFTTSSGVTIQVIEGDITHCDCEVIVHETDENLKMGSELAWTVAKYGGFHINKQLKLYRSIHGHVPNSKVLVTSSIHNLPSSYILHAVAPYWNEEDIRKSRKLLFHTYKNVFRIAGDNFTAVSIALPVFGIAGVSGKPFPLVAACDVMYQALIAATKQGIPLKQVSFVCSDPKQVNAIVTSIKVKIENVHYDTRFLRQPQLQKLHRKRSNRRNNSIL